MRKIIFAAVMAVVGSVAALTAQAGSLPSGYVALEYVECANSNSGAAPTAWFDTGISPASGWKIEAVFAPTNVAVNGCVFCARANTKSDGQSNYMCAFYSVDKKPRFDYCNSQYKGSKSLSESEKHTFTIDGNTMYLDGAVFATGVTTSFGAGDRLVFLGSYASAGSAASGNGASGRFYSGKVWDSFGQLMLDLVPAKRTSDGALGLYDVTGDRFIANSGSGTLKAGPVADMSGCLTIVGSPTNAGAVSPAYGSIDGLKTGDARTCTATEVIVHSQYKTSRCTGWKLYRYNGTDWALSDSGTTTTCAYVHNGTEAKLEWQWEVTYAPQEDAAIRHVSTRGSDANDGTTPANAWRTLEHAIAMASSETKTCIYVEPGAYTGTNTTVNADSVIYIMLLDKPVKVLATDGPAKTIVDASVSKARAYAKITHADAMVAGFTFKNGYYPGKNKATGIEGTAGIVSNCVLSVRGQWAHSGFCLNLASDMKAYDVVIDMPVASYSESSSVISLAGNALIDGLIVTNFTWSGSSGANIISAQNNARIRNALIGGCQMATLGAAKLPSFVYLTSSAVLEDSTIVGNKMLSPNGVIEIAYKNAMVTNCIVWGNETTASVNCDFRDGKNTARVFRTCSSELAADEKTGNTPQDPQFTDLAGGNYRLRAISRSADRGAVWLRPSGSSTFECAADASGYVSASGEPLTVTLSGYTSSGDEGVAAEWDFGDGTTSTDWPTVTHTYNTPGSYTISVTVTKGGETASYTFDRSFVATPKTCYVKTDGTDVYPYDTWEKATPSLAKAYEVGSKEIVVTNGTYDIAAPELAIARAVSIVSVEGPSKTTFNSLGTTTCNHRHLTVSGSDDIFISGFTFVDGYASDYGWTAVIEMSAGTLSNCVVKSTRRVSRSAANYFFGTAKVMDCLFDGHGMTYSNDMNVQSGVRVEGSAVLDRCEITAYRIDNNKTDSSYDGESPVRIASATAIVRNCLIHHCTNGVSQAERHRGPVALVNGRIENCTIVDNCCGGYGGGVWAQAGTIVNSIIYGNIAPMGGKDVWSTSTTPTVRYTAASDFSDWQAGAGEGCTTKSPNFDAENAYHLTALSTACVNKGLTSEALGAYDLDRQPRVVGDAVDMGCYEFAGSTDIPLDGTLGMVGATSGRVPFDAVFEFSPVGDTNGLGVVWNFGVGGTVSGGLIATNTYTTPGHYPVSVTVSNAKGETKTVSLSSPLVVVPQTCYVSKTGSATSPYDTWEKAANDIVTAVALNPKTVLVSNGVYAVSGDGVVLSTDLELRSVNGPDVTVIDAQNECRNVWLTGEGSVCDGFSLVRGCGYWDGKSSFARVQAGTLSHCILSNGCSNVYRDAAVLVKDAGRMVDCVVDTDNMGGNADCTHFWSTVVQAGGVIERCTIQRYNYVNQGGAGSTHFAVHVEDGGIFRNCLVRDCVSTQGGNSGIYRGAIGVWGSGVVENCTVVNAQSCQQGGAITILSTAKESPSVRNNIFWGSTLKDGTKADDIRDLNATTPRVDHCCASNLTAGENGNLASDPSFKRRQGHAYQLSWESPCIDAGVILDWMDDDATDLMGKARIYKKNPEGNLPDMGCYENNLKGVLFLLR